MKNNDSSFRINNKFVYEEILFENWLGSKYKLNYSIDSDGKYKSNVNRSTYNFRSLSFPKKHGYHFVLPSIWPLCVGFNVMLLMLTFVGYLNTGNYVGLLFGLFFNLILVISVWFRDIIEEGISGYHTIIVQKSMKLAMILFIVSEIFFFLCFFWAYYHCFMSPDVMILGQWPPLEIRKPSAWGIPLVNTVILLSSGVSVTWSRMELRRGNIIGTLFGLMLTIVFGILFTLLQLHEYRVSDFGISDTVYGSTFYMLTGFHGFHVIIGTVLLVVSMVRCYLGHFGIRHHVGFICAIWYWHFVDIIWIFVYFSLYINASTYTESIYGLGGLYLR